MLVLTRKKNEALLLDGLIRLEVVSLGRATVRLRLTAPRSLHVAGGSIRRESRVRTSAIESPSPLGVEVIHATLVNQQHLSLGEAIIVAVLDADESRVLLFVDAPMGTNITSLEPEPRDRARQSTKQNLLQFMKLSAERSDAIPEQPSLAASLSEDTSTDEEDGPKLLPFSPPMPHRARG
jgi:sRNA-binding carbon storage regulator CsrA